MLDLEDPNGTVRAILDRSASALLAVDPEGTLIYLNPAATRLLGWGREDLVGRPAAVLVPPDLLARHGPRVAALLADPAAAPIEALPDLRILRKDGREVPVDVSLTAVGTAQGRRVMASIVDATGRLAREGHEESLSRGYRTLGRLNRVLLRASDLSSLYAAACQVPVQFGGYFGAWVGAPDDSGNVVPVASAGELSPALMEVMVPPEWSGREPAPVMAALHEGRSVFVGDFDEVEERYPWHRQAAGRRVGALAALPLRRDGERVAALVLYSAAPRQFDAEFRALLEQVANSVSLGLDRFAADQRLRDTVVQRAQLLGRLVTVQEEERVRIADGIHDDAVQSLAAVDLRLGLLTSLVRETVPHLAPSLDKIQATLSKAAADLHGLLFELDVGHLDAGLAAAVEDAAEHVFERHPTQCRVVGDSTALLGQRELTQVVRIVKEALINVAKHAQATLVTVVISDHDGGVEVLVIDDGVGLPPDAGVARPGHRGLQTMQDRARGIEGGCRVEATPGGGTTVRVWMPAQHPVQHPAPHPAPHPAHSPPGVAGLATQS